MIRTVISSAFSIGLAVSAFAISASAHRIEAPVQVVANPDGTFEFEYTYFAPELPSGVIFEFGYLHSGPLENTEGSDIWADGFCEGGEGGWSFTETLSGFLIDLTEPGTTIVEAEGCNLGYGYIEHITVVQPSTVSVPDAGAAIALRAVPNPMRSTVAFELAESASAAALNIFDASGRAVRTLSLADGFVRWDGRTEAGGRVAAGVYFYRLDRPDASAARLVVLDP